jgi:hypothetical protein
LTVDKEVKSNWCVRCKKVVREKDDSGMSERKVFSSCESVKEREINHCGGGGGWL